MTKEVQDEPEVTTEGILKKRRIRPGTAVHRKNEQIKQTLVKSCASNSAKTTSIMKRTAD